jgi:hypothetical protein
MFFDPASINLAIEQGQRHADLILQGLTTEGRGRPALVHHRSERQPGVIRR